MKSNRGLMAKLSEGTYWREHGDMTRSCYLSTMNCCGWCLESR